MYNESFEQASHLSLRCGTTYDTNKDAAMKRNPHEGIRTLT
jgi:hypothetical protein